MDRTKPAALYAHPNADELVLIDCKSLKTLDRISGLDECELGREAAINRLMNKHPEYYLVNLASNGQAVASWV